MLAGVIGNAAEDETISLSLRGMPESGMLMANSKVNLTS